MQEKDLSLAWALVMSCWNMVLILNPKTLQVLPLFNIMFSMVPFMSNSENQLHYRKSWYNNLLTGHTGAFQPCKSWVNSYNNYEPMLINKEEEDSS